MSDEYKVVYTNKAIAEIRGIHNYISEVLLMPETAKKQINSIMDMVDSLCLMPARNPLYVGGKFKDIRKVKADNFIIFYRVYDNTKVVSIIAVMYGGRDLDKFI